MVVNLVRFLWISYSDVYEWTAFLHLVSGIWLSTWRFLENWLYNRFEVVRDRILNLDLLLLKSSSNVLGFVFDRFFNIPFCHFYPPWCFRIIVSRPASVVRIAEDLVKQWLVYDSGFCRFRKHDIWHGLTFFCSIKIPYCWTPVEVALRGICFSILGLFQKAQTFWKCTFGIVMTSTISNN